MLPAITNGILTITMRAADVGEIVPPTIANAGGTSPAVPTLPTTDPTWTAGTRQQRRHHRELHRHLLRQHLWAGGYFTHRWQSAAAPEPAKDRPLERHTSRPML